MRYLLFISIFITSLSVFAQISNSERRCIKAKNLAIKDMYNKELKYYRFGLIAYTDLLLIENKILKDQYGIEVIQLGCVVSDSVLCYNEEAEKIIKRKYGPNFWDKVRIKVDSVKARE